MINRYISLGATSLIIAFAIAPVAAAEQERKESSQDGAFVKVTGTSLVMTAKGNTDGKEHTFALAPDVKITLDGKDCKAEDIKSGAKIRVTMLGIDAAITCSHVEVIEKNLHFANTHDGKVVSITTDKIVMSNQEGKEHSHSLSDTTKYSCDGKSCKSEDLKEGMRVRITTKRTDQGVAIEVEALDKHVSFALAG